MATDRLVQRDMAGSSLMTNLVLALIVLTSTILVSILVYFTVRLVNRGKFKPGRQSGQESALIDLEAGRESRLSHRLSRQQMQQEHYEDLQQRYSSVPPSPLIELLPEIKTSSNDDRADEWLERGVADEGINVAHGNLGQKKPEMQQAMVIKPKKQLRWDWRDGKLDNISGDPEIVQRTDKEGIVCTEYRAD